MEDWSDRAVDAAFAKGDLDVGVVPPHALARFYLRLAEQLPLRTAPEARDVVARCGVVDDVEPAPLPRDAAARNAVADATARLRKAILIDPRLDRAARSRVARDLLAQSKGTASRVLAVDAAEPGALDADVVWGALVVVVNGGEPARDRAGRKALAVAAAAWLRSASVTKKRIAALDWPASLSLLSADDAVDVASALVDDDEHRGVVIDAAWAALFCRSPRGKVALAVRAAACDDAALQLLLQVLDVDAAVDVVEELWRAGRVNALACAPAAVAGHDRLVDLALAHLHTRPIAALWLLLANPRGRRELCEIALRFDSLDVEQRAAVVAIAQGEVDVVRALLDAHLRHRARDVAGIFHLHHLHHLEDIVGDGGARGELAAAVLREFP